MLSFASEPDPKYFSFGPKLKPGCSKVGKAIKCPETDPVKLAQMDKKYASAAAAMWRRVLQYESLLTTYSFARMWDYHGMVTGSTAAFNTEQRKFAHELKVACISSGRTLQQCGL